MRSKSGPTALRIARITVDELKEKMDAGEQVTIVDLRHSLDFEAEPETIPGALHIEARELEEKNNRLPSGEKYGDPSR